MNTKFNNYGTKLESIKLKSRTWYSGKKKSLLILFILMGLTSVKGISQQAALPFGEGITAKIFHSATVDDNNTVWFGTEAGLVSFDGKKWTLQNINPKVTTADMTDLIYDSFSPNHELLIGTSKGATVAALPFTAGSEATTFLKDNSPIVSENVVAVAAGKSLIKWFGTDKGISAFMDNKWLTNSYSKVYPEKTFLFNKITSMTASLTGDTLYAATAGAGVFRVFRNDVDGISGASEYAEWGPIYMPSDNIQSIYIEPNGTQWLGTDKGIAKHVGYITLENWSVYTTAEGLVDDFVQAISSDGKGNVWFGTRNGVSVFDGTKWTSYKVENGLISNNVLSIAIDKKGVVWLGTDNGVTSITNGKFVSYK